MLNPYDGRVAEIRRVLAQIVFAPHDQQRLSIKERMDYRHRSLRTIALLSLCSLCASSAEARPRRIRKKSHAAASVRPASEAIAPAEAEAEAEDEPAPGAARTPRAAKPSPSVPNLIEVSVGLGVQSREFSVDRAAAGGLYGLSLPATPAMRAELALYPGADSSSGIISGIGLEVGGSASLPISAKNSAGTEFSAVTNSWSVGLRERIRLGALALHARLGYQQMLADISANGALQPGVPAASYKSGFAGVRGEYEQPAWRASLGARLLYTYDAGELSSVRWMPKSSNSSYAFDAAFAYRMTPEWSAFVGAELTLYQFRFEGAAKRADGTSDRFLVGTLGVDYRW